MSRRAFLARRLLWSLFVVWLVVTATFLAFAAAPDPNVNILMWGLPPDEAQAVKAQYYAQMNYDEPLLQRYVLWMTEYLTFDFGRSFVRDAPVNPIIAAAVTKTAAYLVPGVAVAGVLGVAGGLASSLVKGWAGRTADAFGHLGAAFPAFLLAEALALAAAAKAGVLVSWSPELGTFEGSNLTVLVIAATVVAVTLGATLARYAAAETAAVAARDFVKLVRANGGSPRHVVVHVLRNAGPPLVSLFSIRMLTVLLLGVYLVEVALGIPGFGRVTLVAIQDRDVAIILAATLITALVGVVGTLAEDVVNAALDPRVGSE
ncbi:ABC transporter permease [Halobaculum limi]|uniref:ABC transporter permease n=1 Tax=Halobaculum limi TaxID=3031916 RepID=UPI0024057A02|nr:ABC transporter permease [Halobaculum sp. YSMS11]